MYCNYQQDNWSCLLPLAEFAYNNAPNVTTGISPFFANKGYNPMITIYPEWDLTSARAQEFAVNLDELHSTLRTNISKAQKWYQVQVDKYRIPALVSGSCRDKSNSGPPAFPVFVHLHYCLILLFSLPSWTTSQNNYHTPHAPPLL